MLKRCSNTFSASKSIKERRFSISNHSSLVLVSDCKKIPLDFIIDKLLELVDEQASLACSVSSLIDFYQNLFQQFMQKNPVRDFHDVSREEYLQRSKAEKEQLVLSYYNSVVNSEEFIFQFVFS